MNSRWLTVVSVVLAAYAYLAAILQFSDTIDKERFGSISLIRFCTIERELARNDDIFVADGALIPLAGECRKLDMTFPRDARIFIRGMTGRTNIINAGLYFFVTYYLFPRDIAVSLDQPARFTRDGFIGRVSDSDAELASNRFDVVIGTAQADASGTPMAKVWLLRELHLNPAVNPPWFRNGSDAMIAFLLPLLTALSGMALLRFLIPGLNQRMPFAEKLACGLGLGMAAVAALTLGIKLCGFHGHGVILAVTGVVSLVEIGCRRREMGTGLVAGFRVMIQNPVAMVGVLVLLLIFRLASLEGMMEYDAVAGWMLKAKILHEYAGNEIIQWFSAPRLAHAHLDYPVLVPCLHAATYDSIGHVNEFVTKFWPAWMLLLLLVALASLNRNWNGWLPAPSFLFLGLLLLPAVQVYVRMEGGTFPMIFYTVLGFVQCAIWTVEKEPARLALGLVFLLGAALAKFEGFIFMVLAIFWLFVLAPRWPDLKSWRDWWRLPAFGLAALLPFLWLRVQIPVLHFESNWAAYGWDHPGTTLFNAPRLFLILLSRWFVSADLATWTAADGRLHWNGQWHGLSSLYNRPTLGLAWICLLMTIALWFNAPGRRRTVVWMLAVIVSTLAAFSVVFASFISITNLNQVLSYISEEASGRYLLPLLLAWAATSLTLLFTPLSSSASPAPVAPPMAHPPGGSKTVRQRRINSKPGGPV